MGKLLPLPIIAELCIISFLLLVLVKPNAAISVVNFGAKPDGRTDSTQAFQKAWASACSSATPVTLDIPFGGFVVQPTSFTGPCKKQVTLRIKGTIMGPSDYRILAQNNVWLRFYNINGLTINGGTLDARGQSFWACRRGYGNCYKGAQSITFVACTNVLVSGLKSINSQMSHMSVKSCDNVAFKYLTLLASPESLNTDGINVQHTNRLTIHGSVISTGDDCIALGPGTQNTVINKIACGPGHGIRYFSSSFIVME
ncbi:hypothetical protein SOVF_002690 [Spinacia oleracea]|nr:hypothetical protein SOVF_002690 [Spinacia oleracea]